MTPTERQAEIVRRRNARLSVWGPGTFYVQAQLQEIDALYDRAFKQWVLPDEAALERARELVEEGEQRWATDNFREVR